MSSHTYSTQLYAKDHYKHGVFVFPRLPNKKFKNAFFRPWGFACVVMKVPLERVIVTGCGQYDGGYFPEMLISHYSIDDIIFIVYDHELTTSIVYQYGEGALGEPNYPMFLDY